MTGNIRLRSIEPELAARSHDDVTAKTGDGAIRIGRLTRGRAELLNRSGNIEVGISEGTAAWAEANSTRGSVRNSVPSPENPDPSDNKVTVHARTRHGDIIIQRAANSPQRDGVTSAPSR